MGGLIQRLAIKYRNARNLEGKRGTRRVKDELEMEGVTGGLVLGISRGDRQANLWLRSGQKKHRKK